MPKSRYKGRGKVLRYRIKPVSKNEYLTCAILSKPGKRGGRTICSIHKKMKGGFNVVSLKQLKKENKRLKDMQKKLQEMEKTNEYRRKLLKENKTLSRNLKYGKQIAVGKSVGNSLEKIGRSVGKTSTRISKSVWSGLKRYGEYLNEQEMKQRRLNRNLKTIKKTKR